MTKHIRFSLDLTAEPTTPDGSEEVRYGVLDGETVYQTAQWSADRGTAFPLDEVRLLPPCWPSKIVCVGRNYREHAAELGNEVPAEPLIFLKPPSSLLAHGDAIVYPALSQRVDYEGELGVVIGRRAHHVSREDADAYIFGFTCIDDVTARDLQMKDGQWTRAKGFDTFCPVGPWIVPRDEVRLDEVVVRTLLDGRKKQEASLRDMVFSVQEIVAHASRVMTLEPGDLIATGTPSGIGPMQPGAVIEIVIDGVGALRNLVVKP